jgi:CRP/FNR family cyclic AMP-dependent transcriptional regulator
MATVDLVKRERNTKHYAAGDIIFAEGDPSGDCFYVLESGEVEIANSRKLLETVHDGGFFGEMGLINHKPRTATAVAKTDSVVIQVNEGDFYFMIQHSPFFAIEVMQVLSDRVRRNIE